MAEDLTTGAAEGAPAPDSGSTTGGDPSATPSGQSAGQFVDITDPDRYRYNGRSVKDWDSGFMRHQDYSQKTAAIAQERKYFENLSYDLDKVRQDPRLADQFRQVYPEKFHNYLRFTQSGNPQQPPNAQGQPNGQPQYAPMDPRFVSEFNQMKEANRTREVQAISAELDAVYGRMAQKYPFADEEAVTARAQALFQKLKEQDPLNPNIRISEKQWDALWKSQHERAHGISDAQYKKQVKAQLEASRKGADAGGGGGIPGTAPRQYKTIKEATTQALADIETGSF